MKEINFKNIVNYIECFSYKQELWLVMEYLDFGALTEIVTKTCFSEEQTATVLNECLLALDYLHSNKIIHRDIKRLDFH
jgi:serine/threonine protein kinase